MRPVRTTAWDEMLRKLEADDQHFDGSYLPLVRHIAKSPWSSELFGGIFLSGLLISDTPDFEFGPHMLAVRYDSIRGCWMLNYAGVGRKGDCYDKKASAEELIPAVELVLKVKFGVSLQVPKLV